MYVVPIQAYNCRLTCEAALPSVLPEEASSCCKLSISWSLLCSDASSELSWLFIPSNCCCNSACTHGTRLENLQQADVEARATVGHTRRHCVAHQKTLCGTPDMVWHTRHCIAHRTCCERAKLGSACTYKACTAQSTAMPSINNPVKCATLSANKQTGRQTQTDRHTDRHAGRHANRQTHIHAGRHADRYTDR